jgi:hypothetical protein
MAMLPRMNGPQIPKYEEDFLFNILRLIYQFFFVLHQRDGAARVSSRFFEAEGLKLLGVSIDAWAEAVEAMGREQATAAVSIILQRAPEAAVDSPGGYLRGMSAKARAGKLDLSTTLRWMALKRAGGR